EAPTTTRRGGGRARVPPARPVGATLGAGCIVPALRAAGHAHARRGARDLRGGAAACGNGRPGCRAACPVRSGATREAPALPPEARVRAAIGAAGVDRRSALRSRLPPASRGPARPRQRGGPEAPGGTDAIGTARSRSAALGDVARRGPRA